VLFADVCAKTIAVGFLADTLHRLLYCTVRLYVAVCVVAPDVALIVSV